MAVTVIEDDAATYVPLCAYLEDVHGVAAKVLTSVAALKEALRRDDLARVVLSDRDLTDGSVDFGDLVAHLGRAGGPRALYLLTSHGFSEEDLRSLQVQAGPNVFIQPARKPFTDSEALLEEVKKSVSILSTYAETPSGEYVPQWEGDCIV